MILYHGTTEVDADNIVSLGIDVNYGRKKCDFGVGFYTTPNIERANDWALTKGFVSKPGIVSIKVLNISSSIDIMPDLSIKIFPTISLSSSDKDKLEWGQFVVSNRCGLEYVQSLSICEHNLDRRYDIVIGPIADGKIGRIARECFRENRMVTVQEVDNLLEKDLGFQYSFCTQKSLSALESKPIKKGVVLR